jgi:DNA-binding IclR family transcriptional regulator
MEQGHSSPQTVRSVERAIDVLDAIRGQGGRAGVSEISQELGLAKSTVHRLLVALANKGMVRQDEETERYILGYKALEMAFGALQDRDVISVALPYLEELRDRLGETAALALKVGKRYTYVSQVPCRHEYRVTPVLGHHYPLHWAATGKAILAYLPPDEVDACLVLVPGSRSTPRTVVDPDLLRTQLDEIRRAGYAASFGERSPGAAAVAAPIRNRKREAHASACIVGPESRMQPGDIPALGAAVAEVSARIETICQTLGLGS